jgi:hypothetical protein
VKRLLLLAVVVFGSLTFAPHASANTYCNAAGTGPNDPVYTLYGVRAVTNCATNGNNALIIATCAQVYATYNGVSNWVTVDGQCNSNGDLVDYGACQPNDKLWYRTTMVYWNNTPYGGQWSSPQKQTCKLITT